MASKSRVWTFLALALLALALAACSAAPTALPTPTQAPTIDPQPTFDAIATQSAQTVVANLTLSAPTATPVPPTETPAPTPTTGPTNTPAPTATATRVFIPWTATPSATAVVYGCTVTDVSPKSTDTIKVDQDFDAKWTLKNTGSETWISSNSDFRFTGGTKLHQGGDLVDLKSDVAPNGTYTLTMDMRAPAGDGTYKTSWELVLGDGSVCALNMTINVTK
jgi:hypothetical protein